MGYAAGQAPQGVESLRALQSLSEDLALRHIDHEAGHRQGGPVGVVGHPAPRFDPHQSVIVADDPMLADVLLARPRSVSNPVEQLLLVVGVHHGDVGAPVLGGPTARLSEDL